MDAQLKDVVSRLENLASRFEAVCPGGMRASSVSSTENASNSPIVLSFNEAINAPMAKFQQLSSSIGGVVAEMGTQVLNAFKLQKDFVVVASKYAKPSDSEILKLHKPTSLAIQNIQAFREKNRPSNLFNHLSAISESIPALGWIAVTPTPAPYIKELLDAGQFYTNRILKDYKGQNQTHVDWVASWSQIVNALHGYVKQYHTTGVVWNPKGAPAVYAPSGVPPPPGPPPPPPPMDFSDSAPPADDGRAKLFASISQGGDITKSLKKVKTEEMTHKNPTLRAGSIVPEKTSNVNSAGTAKSAPVVAKPPVFELCGKKWLVENFTAEHQLIIEDTEMNHSVYIYKCTNCTIQVKGKINSIVMDACKKTTLVFENIVACVEFINCQSVKTQVLGIVPTVSIDKTDGFQLFLSKDSMNCEIVSSKCSEMNVLYLKENGEFFEVPLPEQFKTAWNGKKFKTIATELAA